MHMADFAQNLSVVIFEREYLLGLDLAQQLQASGFNVVDIFNDPNKLHDAVLTGQLDFDVALLDLHLDSPDYLGLVSGLNQDGVSVVLTGTSMASNLPEALKPFPYFSKPTVFDQVLAGIRALLALRGDRHID